jgi:non-homologous end joining protein Ku
MASTIWKGQLTFGLLAFPVRLQKAARRERVALKYVRETRAEAAEEPEPAEQEEESQEPTKPPFAGGPHPSDPPEPTGEIRPVRQGYFSEGQREPSTTADLQRGYEVAPDKFVVVRAEELKSLRKATSPDMQILRLSGSRSKRLGLAGSLPPRSREIHPGSM